VCVYYIWSLIKNKCEKKKGKYGIIRYRLLLWSHQHLLGHGSLMAGGPCWNLGGQDENGVPSPQIFTARCYASAVVAIGLCLSVRLSVTSRCSIETTERIELFFGMQASFHPSYTVLKGNSVISKNNGTFLWNFVVNSGLRKFRHGISIVETCYQLSSRKVDAQSVINWAVVGQLSR